METDLTYAQRRILVEVAFSPTPLKKSDVKDKKPRDFLEKSGYLNYEKWPPPLRGDQIILTEKGWGWLSDHLGIALVDPKSPARRAYGLLSNVMKLLGQGLKARNLSLAEFMIAPTSPLLSSSASPPTPSLSSSPSTQDEERAVPSSSASPPTPSSLPPPPTQGEERAVPSSSASYPASSSFPPPPTQDEERAIQHAYIQASGGQWATRVHLSDLRSALSEISRERLDDLLLELQNQNALILMPLPSPSKKDQEAAIHLPGGVSRHIVYMEARI